LNRELENEVPSQRIYKIGGKRSEIKVEGGEGGEKMSSRDTRPGCLQDRNYW